MTKTKTKNSQNRPDASAPPTSRWFRVTGDRFDWIVKPNVMISFRHGDIGYRPQTCINAGLAGGVIMVIDKPEGYSVDKAGNVVKNGH